MSAVGHSDDAGQSRPTEEKEDNKTVEPADKDTKKDAGKTDKELKKAGKKVSKAVTWDLLEEGAAEAVGEASVEAVAGEAIDSIPGGNILKDILCCLCKPCITKGV